MVGDGADRLLLHIEQLDGPFAAAERPLRRGPRAVVRGLAVLRVADLRRRAPVDRLLRAHLAAGFALVLAGVFAAGFAELSVLAD